MIVYAWCGKEYIGEIGNQQNLLTFHNQQTENITIRMLQVSRHIHNCDQENTPKYHKCFLSLKDKQIVLEIESNGSLFYIRTLRLALAQSVLENNTLHCYLLHHCHTVSESLDFCVVSSFSPDWQNIFHISYHIDQLTYKLHCYIIYYIIYKYTWIVDGKRMVSLPCNSKIRS